jgi:alanine racemase
LIDILRHHSDNYSLLVTSGLFTRIHDASHDEQTRQQLIAVQEFQFNLQREKIPIPSTHILTSETLIRWSDPYIFDGVRLGEALYGMNSNYPEIMTALTLKTKVIATFAAKSGEHVGYRPQITTNRLTKIAVIQIGYLNGLDRRVREKGSVILRRRRCKYIGGVGPYLSLIDITGLGRISEGEIATILGKDEKEEISLPEMAEWIGKPAVEWINCLTHGVTHNKSK